MSDIERMRHLAGLNEEDMDEIAFRKLIDEVYKISDRLEFLSTSNGPLTKRVDALGGDMSPVETLRDVAEEVYRAAEEIEYHALAHRAQR